MKANRLIASAAIAALALTTAAHAAENPTYTSADDSSRFTLFLASMENFKGKDTPNPAALVEIRDLTQKVDPIKFIAIVHGCAHTFGKVIYRDLSKAEETVQVWAKGGATITDHLAVDICRYTGKLK